MLVMLTPEHPLLFHASEHKGYCLLEPEDLLFVNSGEHEGYCLLTLRVFCLFRFVNMRDIVRLLDPQGLLLVHIGEHEGDVGGEEVVHLVAQARLAQQLRATHQIPYRSRQ